MTYVQMGSPGGQDSYPDNVYYGRRIIGDKPGMPGQADGAACLAELLEEQEGEKKRYGGEILKNTVDTGEPIATVPGVGAVTVRRCGREACQAECQLTIGAYAHLQRVGYDKETDTVTHCQSRPIRRRAWRILRSITN